VDDEFNEYAITLLAFAPTLVFGRLTYAHTAACWPTKVAMKSDSVIARRMNGLEKVVFSKTLQAVEWRNLR
jgi:hypothetical protein